MRRGGRRSVPRDRPPSSFRRREVVVYNVRVSAPASRALADGLHDESPTRVTAERRFSRLDRDHRNSCVVTAAMKRK
jgi:hypothetical protein